MRRVSTTAKGGVVAMDTAPAGQPSVAELVRAISEEAVAPAAPAPAVIQLPRPHPFARVLVLGIVGLILVLATLLVVLMRHVQDLLGDIRTREELLANPPLPPLPANERLLDAATFAIELAGQPTRHARLHAARAHALVDAGRAAEAIEGFALAARLGDAPLAPGDRVALGAALMAAGRAAEARTVLIGIDPTRLGVTERERCHELLARLTLDGLREERRRPRGSTPGAAAPTVPATAAHPSDQK